MQAARTDLSQLVTFPHDALKAPALFLPLIASSLGKGSLQTDHKLLAEPKQRVERNRCIDVSRDPAGGHDFDHLAAVGGDEAAYVFHGLIVASGIDFGDATAHPSSQSGVR